MDNALISYPHNFFLQYKTAKLWIKSGTKGAQVYVYTNPLKKKMDFVVIGTCVFN